MAVYTVYTATLNARATKERTCPSCGCVYQSSVDVKAKETGGLEVIARERAAGQLAKKALADRDKTACPGCGYWPPDVAAYNRACWVGLVCSLALFVNFATMVCFVLRLVPKEHEIPILAALSGGTLLAYFATYAMNPNSNPEKNLWHARAAVEGGRITVVQPGRESVGPPPSPKYPFLIPIAVALSLSFPVALWWGMQQPKPDLPVNSVIQEDIIRPTKPFTIRVPGGFKSVDGLFKGTVATVKVLNAKEVGCPEKLSASPQNSNWDKRIRPDAGEDRPAELQIKVFLPPDLKLGGKELRCKLELDAFYPFRVTPKTFDEKFIKVQHEFVARIATKEQAAQHDRVKLAGILLLVSLLASAIGGMLFAAATYGRGADGHGPKLVGLEA